MKLTIKCTPQARVKCPFDHPCDCEEKAYFEEGSPCDKFNKKLMPPPPMTNADRIRAMSDEELAKLLTHISEVGCPSAARRCKERCIDCFFDWLKQPAEEVDDG